MDDLKIMVVGAGTMGVEIALTFSMAGCLVNLIDLPSAGGEKQLSDRAISAALLRYAADNERKDALGRIKTGNMRDNLPTAIGVDWIIEAVPENLEIKARVYNDLVGYVDPEVVISSNTSGLSIAELRSRLPSPIKSRLIGTHFFNPASKNPLVEIIPAGMENAWIQSVISILRNRLGKTCVVSEDVPNFIVNRFAVMTMMEAIENVIDFGLSVRAADVLGGVVIGRPRTAIFGLLDLIGIDVWQAICENMQVGRIFPGSAKLIQELVDRRYLGRKSGAGFYRYSAYQTKGGGRAWLDHRTFEYQEGGYQNQDQTQFLALNDRIRIISAYADDFPEKLFQRNLIYSALEAGKHVVRFAPGGEEDVDTAICLGLGHEIGPFALGRLLGGG